MSTSNSSKPDAVESERDSALPLKTFHFIPGSGTYDQVVRRLSREQQPYFDPSWQVDHDLRAYYDLLQHALTTVHLQHGEVMCLLDVSNGTLFSPTAGQLLPNFSDADESSYTKWGVERMAMITVVQGFTPWQERAVIDAMVRADVVMENEGLSLDAACKKVGLLH